MKRRHFLTSLACTVFMPNISRAAVYNVISSENDGPGTFRDNIRSCNIAGGGIIEIKPGLSIDLTSSLFPVTAPITIIGNGATLNFSNAGIGHGLILGGSTGNHRVESLEVAFANDCGVVLTGGGNSQIIGLTAHSCGHEGLSIEQSKNNQINNCCIGNNGRYGMKISIGQRAAGNIINECDIGCKTDGSPWPNVRSGMLVYNTQGTIVTNNNLCHNHRSGITVDGSKLPKTSPSYDKFGAFTGQGYANHTKIYGNKIVGNGLRGVLIFEGHDNLIAHNNIDKNPIGVDLIRLEKDQAALLATIRNTIIGNIFNNNTQAAIRLKWAKDTKILDNHYFNTQTKISRQYDSGTLIRE